jgi:integral membrane protein
MDVAFRRYRIMSFVTGSTLITLYVMLLLHTFDLTLWKHLKILVDVDGLAHGFVMYPLYMIASFNMVLKFRLPLALLVLMLLAGFFPGVAFYLEHRLRLKFYPQGLPAR